MSFDSICDREDAMRWRHASCREHDRDGDGPQKSEQ
jgi:hypothetical protein